MIRMLKQRLDTADVRRYQNDAWRMVGEVLAKSNVPIDAEVKIVTVNHKYVGEFLEIHAVWDE